jgi:hypothetical protein
MVKALVTMPNGATVLVVGLIEKNYDRFNVAPDPKVVDAVITVIGATQEDLAEALKANGLLPSGATIRPVAKPEPPAKQQVGPPTPKPVTAALRGAAKKLTKAKPKGKKR